MNFVAPKFLLWFCWVTFWCSDLLQFHFIEQVGFAAADSVTGLKLIEAGVKKETLAFLAVPLVPLQILLPLLISRLTTGRTNIFSYVLSIQYICYTLYLPPDASLLMWSIGMHSGLFWVALLLLRKHLKEQVGECLERS